MPPGAVRDVRYSLRPVAYHSVNGKICCCCAVVVVIGKWICCAVYAVVKHFVCAVEKDIFLH